MDIGGLYPVNYDFKTVTKKRTYNFIILKLKQAKLEKLSQANRQVEINFNIIFKTL